MNFMPDFGGFVQQVQQLASDNDLVKDPDKIAELKKTLLHNAGLLERGGFNDVDVAESAFGQSNAAARLGLEHRLAHTVVADTILGVVDDLLTFRTGVVEFEKHVDQADNDAEVDFAQKRQGVEALLAASRYSSGDTRNHESRNENLPGNDPVGQGVDD